MTSNPYMAANPEDLFGGTSALLDLIGLIYQSAQDPSLWPEILRRISVAIRGNETFVFTSTLDETLPMAVVGAGSNSEAAEEFLEYYASVNLIGEACDAVYREGEVRYSHRVVPDDVLVKTEFYNDFFRRHDMFYSYGIKMPLVKDGMLYISCQRPQNAGAFDDREGAVLTTLFPHIVRAFNMRQQMGAMGSALSGVASILDALDHAVFGLNVEGRITFANRMAEDLASRGGVLKICRGRLRALDPAQDNLLQAFIANATAVGRELTATTGGVVNLTDSGGRPVLRAVTTPSPEPFGTGNNRTVALVTLHALEMEPAARGDVLKMLFGLTPVEQRMAAHLLAGRDLKEAAEALRITVETGRFHVKRLLAKTGTRKQSELIRLMQSLPGRYTPVQD